MDISVEVNAFKGILTSSSTVVILLPESANRDAVAAGLALYLSLLNLGKNVTVAYPKAAIVGWSHLVGLNKLTQKLGNKNFVISLDYTEGSIEKVSYNIEGSKFNLVVEPRVGAPLFDEKKVSYSYSGFTADLVITITAASLEALGKFYSENRPLFAEKPVIAIDYRLGANYGKVNLVRAVTSASEMVAHIIKTAQLPLNGDIASNLYDGILVGGRNFTHPAVSADTFEAVAWLLRQGARKNALRQEETPVRELVKQESPDMATPPDWLKPKIYKGSTLL